MGRNIGAIKKGQMYKFMKMLERQFNGVNYLSKTDESLIDANDIGEVNCDFVHHEYVIGTQIAVIGEIINLKGIKKKFN